MIHARIHPDIMPPGPRRQTPPPKTPPLGSRPPGAAPTPRRGSARIGRENVVQKLTKLKCTQHQRPENSSALRFGIKALFGSSEDFVESLLARGPEVLGNLWDKAGRAGRLEMMRERLCTI